MTYDAENNRIAMQSERYSETYVVDSVSDSLSRVLTIIDGSGSSTLCVYGSGLICEKTGDIYSYHHYNNLGSTTKLTDAKGAVTASFTYGTYGELLSGSTGHTRFLYNGRCGVTTDDNGLYYMRQRYYNPEVKRFVNQDILSGNLSNSQSLNRYSYVQGNPVSYTDPFGLSPLNGLFKGNTLWHGVLGLFGMVPGPLGAAANFIDGFIYLYEKDYFGAALCFTNFATMGATSYATYAVKAGKFGKTASAAVKVAMISERISGGLCFAKNTYNVGKSGIQMYCKYGILEQSFGLDTVGEVLGIGFSIVGALGGLNRMVSNSPELIALKNEVDELNGERIPDFYVGTNGKILPSQYKDWIGTNMQKELLGQAENPQLQNAIKQLYRGNSFIGDGGTADVIRFEKMTGIMLGKNGGSHVQKGIDMAKYIEDKILSQDLSYSDRALAIRLLEDLNNALGR